MQAAKEFVKQNGYGDRISFANGEKFTVTLLKEKVDSIPDPKGGTVTGMKFLVSHEGVEKSFFTGSIGLISKLAMCELGDVVTINMYKANNKSYYNVLKGGVAVGIDEDAPIADGQNAPADVSW